MGKKLLVLLAAMMLCATYTIAQTSTATLIGVITDDTGAVLPGVEVTATRTGTGEVRIVVTADNGVFRFLNVPPGVYTLRASLTGFKTVTNEDLRLTIGETLRADMTLSVGEITEEIVVQAQAQTVNKEEGRLSELIESAEVQELPLNGRNAYQLAQLGPGVFPTMGVVSQSSGSNAGPSFVVNGQSHRANNFLMDGTDNNYVGIAGTPSVTPQVDIIDEFRVQTNNFSAEFGRNAGAIVNVLTKSGTNEFHGTIYYFHRNDALDASEFFDPYNSTTGKKEGPPLKQHTYGFTIGGPIWKERTFFFGGFEGFRETSGESSSFQVETQQLLDYVRTQQAGSIADQLFSRFPLTQSVPNTGRDIGSPSGNPNNDGPRDGIPDVSDLSLFGATKDTSDQWNVRIDHTISDNDRIYGRFTRSKSEGPPSIVRPSTDSIGIITEQAATFSYTRVINPSMVNEFRLGWNEREPNFDVQQGTFDVPTIGITGFSPDFGAASNIPQFFARHTYQLANSLSWARGNHSLKMGFEFRHGQENSDFQASTRGVYNFNSILNFAENLPFSQNNLVDGNLNPIGTPRHFRVNEWALYLQDDIKVNSNFTFNIGLRYENFRPPYESDGIQVNGVFGSGDNIFDRYRTATLEVFERGRDIYAPDNNNFAPRLGFAWDPTGEGLWSIRGGYGISYNRIFMNITSNIKFNSPTNPSAADRLIFGRNVTASVTNGLPICYAVPTCVDPALGDVNQGGRVNPNILDPDLATSYVQSIFLGVQREVFGDWLLEANYVSTLGRKLYAQEHYNRFTGDLLDGTSEGWNPLWGVGGDDFLTASINQAYHGGQFSANKRFRDGLGFRINYTWSKNIDSDTDVFGATSDDAGSSVIENRFLDRAVSSLHVPHRLAMNWVWDMPWYRDADNWALRNIIGGWQVNGLVALQTGLPAAITADSSSFASTISDGMGGRVRRGDFNADGWTDDRPNAPVFGVSDINVSNALRNGGMFVAFAGPNGDQRLAFPRPVDGIPGTLGRNTFRYHGFNSFDLSLFKNFGIPWYGPEDARLQFRAEFFNLFNRVNFNPWEEDIASGNFGRSLSTQDAREIQLALKIIF